LHFINWLLNVYMPKQIKFRFLRIIYIIISIKLISIEKLSNYQFY